MRAPGWAIWPSLGLVLILGLVIGIHACRSSLDAGLLTDITTGCKHAPAPDQLPMSVVLDASSDGREQDVVAGVAFWNRLLGETVLQYNGRTASPEEASGFVVRESFDPKDFPTIVSGVTLPDPTAEEMPSEVLGLARQSFAVGCRLARVDIVLRGDPTLVDSLKARVTAHELGHALGLGHDNTKLGRLMHPIAKFGGYDVSALDKGELLTAFAPPGSGPE